VTSLKNDNPLPLSVAIACKNNEATLGRTLDSIAGLASEIVAADSGSRDGTVRLLKQAGASVVKTRWLGYVRTKQLAIDHCTQPWVLLLDSDESLEPDLARSIRRLIGETPTGVVGARVNRRVWYRGKPLMHAFQPEWRVRLALREKVTIAGYDPHDRVDVELGPSERLEDLTGDLRHDSFDSIASHLQRQARHARDAARSLHAMQRTTGVPAMLLAAPSELIKHGIIKQGFRDGVAGWLAAASMAAYAVMKHAALLELQHYGEPVKEEKTERRRSKKKKTEPAKPAEAPSKKETMPEETAARSAAEAPAVEPKPEREEAAEAPQPTPDAQTHETPPDGTPAEDAAKKKKRRRKRKKKPAEDGGEAASSGEPEEIETEGEPTDRPKRGIEAVTPISEEARRQVFDVDQTFESLGLKPEILETLHDAGWVHPTKIQAGLIPLALQGKDVLGQAKTGSGKTAAFGLPMLHMIEKGRPFQALVLGPTRELALQIRDELEALGAKTGLRVVPVYGGQKIPTQARRLEKQPEIIVGTPGRVQDMHNRGLLPFDKLRFAVLDEVDRMFDIGFRDEIRRILGLCPKERQTIFVSATISDEIDRLARKHMRDPERLNVTSGSLTVEMVRQRHIPVQAWDKRRMLVHVLTHEEPDLTLVFCRMKRTVDDIVRYLSGKGIEAHALHGDMSQGARNQTMRNFRHGELKVLVASDLAARGLDVEGITHVVNYDLPEDPDLYVHRIGRTARAGRDGVAWSLVTPEQGPLLTQIENLINAEIPKQEYPDFDARAEPPEGWRPEPKPGQYQVAGVPEPESRNRYDDTPRTPDERKLSEEELAKKFPGGVVPKKPPKKRLRGTLRTARMNKED